MSWLDFVGGCLEAYDLWLAARRNPKGCLVVLAMLAALVVVALVWG